MASSKHIYNQDDRPSEDTGYVTHAKEGYISIELGNVSEEKKEENRRMILNHTIAKAFTFKLNPNLLKIILSNGHGYYTTNADITSLNYYREKIFFSLRCYQMDKLIKTNAYKGSFEEIVQKELEEFEQSHIDIDPLNLLQAKLQARRSVNQVKQITQGNPTVPAAPSTTHLSHTEPLLIEYSIKAYKTDDPGQLQFLENFIPELRKKPDKTKLDYLEKYIQQLQKQKPLFGFGDAKAQINTLIRLLTDLQKLFGDKNEIEKVAANERNKKLEFHRNYLGEYFNPNPSKAYYYHHSHFDSYETEVRNVVRKFNKAKKCFNKFDEQIKSLGQKSKNQLNAAIDKIVSEAIQKRQISTFDYDWSFITSEKDKLDVVINNLLNIGNKISMPYIYEDRQIKEITNNASLLIEALKKTKEDEFVELKKIAKKYYDALLKHVYHANYQGSGTPNKTVYEEVAADDHKLKAIAKTLYNEVNTLKQSMVFDNLDHVQLLSGTNQPLLADESTSKNQHSISLNDSDKKAIKTYKESSDSIIFQLIINQSLQEFSTNYPRYLDKGHPLYAENPVSYTFHDLEKLKTLTQEQGKLIHGIFKFYTTSQSNHLAPFQWKYILTRLERSREECLRNHFQLINFDLAEEKYAEGKDSLQKYYSHLLKRINQDISNVRKILNFAPELTQPKIDIDEQKSNVKLSTSQIDAYYQLLQINKDEQNSIPAIKRHYNSLSLIYHPDKLTKLEGEEQKRRNDIFIKITEAKNALIEHLTATLKADQENKEEVVVQADSKSTEEKKENSVEQLSEEKDSEEDTSSAEASSSEDSEEEDAIMEMEIPGTPKDKKSSRNSSHSFFTGKSDQENLPESQNKDTFNSQPKINEEKYLHAIKLLKKYSDQYHAYLEDSSKKLELKSKTADSKLNDKISRSNQKKSAVLAMKTCLENKDNTKPEEKIKEFESLFVDFSEKFKKDGPEEDQKAKSKFKRRVAYAFASLGIYALARAYELGTFKFWKSHRQAFKDKAVDAQKKLRK